ncbi:MAG: thioester reductase domain-containing protein [bacterium]
MGSSITSILDRFYEWTERTPDQLLFAFLDKSGRTTESYTYAQFLQRTTDIASYLWRTHPMEPGSRVLLVYPPGVEMICAFFACVRLGLIPVPVHPPSGQGFKASLFKMNFIARDCEPSAVLTDRSYYWSMQLNQTRHRVSTLSLKRDYTSKLTWIVSTNADKGAQVDFPQAHSDIVFLQYTSGSTNDPKGVMVSHENLLDNCTSVVDHRPIGVSWLPQYHDMGLIGYYIYFALMGGTTYGFSPLDFIERPALWLETISKYGGTASSAPNFAYEYCLRPEKLPADLFENLDLSSLRFLMTAAEPVRANTYQAFIEKFEPYGLNPKALFSAYGLAEYTLAVTNYGRTIEQFERDGIARRQVKIATKRDDSTALVSCGHPLGTTEIKIVDITDEPREAGDAEIGEIWIRGASKCQGYWKRPELSAATFDAKLSGEAPDSPGWLRSGDLGFLHNDELYICGRTKDIIIVRGLNYYPQDVEVIVAEDRAIRKGCVSAFSFDHGGREQLVVVAELKDPKRLPDCRAINQKILETLGVAADVFVFIPARTLPKTSSGKLVRHLARSQWIDGHLKVIHQVESEAHSDVSKSLDSGDVHALLRAFGLTGEETWTLADAGFDSVKLVEFSQSLTKFLAAKGFDSATAIDLRVLQKIAISELVGLLEQTVAAGPLDKLRFERAILELGRSHQNDERQMMRRDAALRFDAAQMLREIAPLTQKDGGILLTGGTGFFGPFLLASLLRQTDEHIYVLVRAADREQGMQRLREGLAEISNDADPYPTDWERRVHPVCGDLAATNFGLSADVWQTLAEDVHTIYHNGAIVNYLHDYASMRDANVGGTNEIIRLALSHRAKVLNHISTTFVFGWSVKDTLLETDRNEDMEHLDFGYSQSKWVSEQVVFDAMQQGLKARVFRPALLTPSVTGAGGNLDISIRLLAFMVNHRMGTTAKNQVSFSPADRAADNIVAISRVEESVGKTYHVTRDAYANMSDITSILSALTAQPFDHYPLDEFVPKVIERCQKEDILFPLLEFFERSQENISAMQFKRYDNSNFQQFRDTAHGGRPDPPLDDVVAGILRFMRRRKIVRY